MTVDQSHFRLAAISIAALAFAGCGTEAPEPTHAPEPAATPTETASVDTPEPPTPPATDPVVAPASAEADVEPDAAPEEPHDHAEGEHGHDHGDGEHSHDHGGEGDKDHGHDHGDHDHGEHGHDHGDDHGHSHAGGEAHVHGAAEGALILEGDTLTLSLDGALASFGISEAPVETEADEAARQAALNAFADDSAVLVINDEAGCELTQTSQSVRAVGGAANGTFDYSYTCASVDALSDVMFTIFESTPSMETIELAVLQGDSQDGVMLTAGSNTVSLSGD
ncbi:MAG: DUF2796 domain-containing protein [Pseudomonadota bacterium]